MLEQTRGQSTHWLELSTMEPSVRQEFGVQDEDCAGDLDWDRLGRTMPNGLQQLGYSQPPTGSVATHQHMMFMALRMYMLENHSSKFTDAGLNAVTKGKGIEKGHRFQDWQMMNGKITYFFGEPMESMLTATVHVFSEVGLLHRTTCLGCQQCICFLEKESRSSLEK